MKKIKRLRNNILLHPLMAFLLLTVFVIVLSGILDLFDASVTYNKINIKTGGVESTLVTVESLFNLSGIKYIFSNTLSNFVSFTPLATLMVILLGIGIMDKSGFLDTIFFVITRRVSKTTLTFIFTVICILATIAGDISFIIFIPLSALLFKYGKRNPLVGIITSFVAICLGYSMNLGISSTTSSLIDYTNQAVNVITQVHSVNSWCYLFIMFVATLIGAGIITKNKKKIVAPKLGKYEVEEETVEKDSLTRRELRGLIIAGIGATIYMLVFIYNIIPNVPLGGTLLDYSQTRYIDKLFGINSFFNSGFVFVVTMLFFIVGLLYGIATKTFKSHRDIFDFMSHSLDGIGKVIVLIFFASMFVSLLKYTNIGTLITAALANLINNANFSGIPLLLLVLFVSIISTLLMPTFMNRWSVLSATVVPAMMTSGFTSEFAQLVFSIGSSIAYPLTPAMAYFVIYVSYLEKYDKEGTGLIKSIKYVIPYVIAFLIMWIVLFILWYLIGLPLGINTTSVL